MLAILAIAVAGDSTLQTADSSRTLVALASGRGDPHLQVCVMEIYSRLSLYCHQ